MSSDPERQRELESAAGRNAGAFNDYYAHRITAEMDARDRERLLTGNPAPIDYSRVSRSEYGELKNRSKEFNPADYEEGNVTNVGIEWMDLFAHDALSSNGFRIATRPSKAVNKDGEVMDGVTTPDIEIDGEMWEIKSPRNGNQRHNQKNELKFIEQLFRSARDNFKNPYDYTQLRGSGDKREITKFVLNTRYRTINAFEAEISKEIQRFIDRYGVECIWIDASGHIRRFK